MTSASLGMASAGTLRARGDAGPGHRRPRTCWLPRVNWSTSVVRAGADASCPC